MTTTTNDGDIVVRSGRDRLTATRPPMRLAAGPVGRSHASARTLVAVVVLAIAWMAPAATAAATERPELPALEVFWAEGCPYCAAERAWLPTLESRHPEVRVVQYEVSRHAGNRELLQRRAAEVGVAVRGVPMTFFGADHWVGFDQQIADEISATVARATQGAASSAASPPDRPAVIAVPVLGEVDVGSTSLVVSTVLIGALDGLNPCSLWVLSVLLAMVLHTGSRRRVLAVGATFLAVTAGMYALYVGGLYGVLSFVAHIGWIRVALALVAGTFGALALMDFFASGRRFTLAIPERYKPGIYRRARQVAGADRSLAPVLGGTVLLAVGVSLVETPCTAGFPVVWSNLLATQGVGGLDAVGLFSLYMLVFLVDEVAVFAAAVVTLRTFKLQERHGRVLKLVGGAVMLTLAATMLAAPTLLESLTGTLGVFAAAAMLTAAIALLHRPRRAGDRRTAAPTTRQHCDRATHTTGRDG